MLKPVPTAYSARPAFQRWFAGPGKISASSWNDVTLRGTKHVSFEACGDNSSRGAARPDGGPLGDADDVDVDTPIDGEAIAGLALGFAVDAAAGAEVEVDVVADAAAGDAAGVTVTVEVAVTAGVAEVEVVVDAVDSAGSDLEDFDFDRFLASTSGAWSPLASSAARIRCPMRPNFRPAHIIRIPPICHQRRWCCVAMTCASSPADTELYATSLLVHQTKQ